MTHKYVVQLYTSKNKLEEYFFNEYDRALEFYKRCETSPYDCILKQRTDFGYIYGTLTHNYDHSQI